MKIAVISDLHLGTGKSDPFGHEESRFLRFLDHLEHNFERVVLLGDIFETLSVRPAAQVRELARAKDNHKAIVARFERSNYTYLHGNHDLVAGCVDGSPDALQLNVDGMRIAFMHGHQFDWVVKRARFVSEWAAWLAGWVQRLGMAPVLKATAVVERLVMGVSKAASNGAQLFDAQGKVIAPKADRFQRAAIGWANASGVDIVVTGHTHCGVVASHGDRLFLNSGSCAEGAFSYLAMDTSAGSYAVETSW